MIDRRSKIHPRKLHTANSAGIPIGRYVGAVVGYAAGL